MTENTKQTERDDRLKKITDLKEQGINPYPAKSNRSHLVSKALADFFALQDNETEITLAGRLRSLRDHGNISFADLEDASGRMQLVITKNDLGDNYKSFIRSIDSSDFIEARGVLIITKAGEKSLLIKSWRLLSKALRNIPSEHFGLEDEEERLRRRYLDILLRPELKDMIIKKDKFWNAVRTFLKERDFIEVETPVLETTAGGADAKPFATHHNALDIDVFLRISMGELWQKKLMVAGLEKTFEIGRQFRNEGMDAEHLQDYTQMEFYWAYADYEKGMHLVEELYKYVALETFGTLKFEIGKFTVDLGEPWQRYDYRQTVLEHTGIDILTADLPSMEAKLKELKVEYDRKGFNITRAIDNLWKYCRKQIGGPGFLIGVPTTVSPLAKRDDFQPEIAQRFQPIIAGSELGNGYSELNDPIDQLGRFNEQAALREAGDDEAQMKDEEFVEALEYGMPPTCGFGMSERVFAFLMGKSARECQIFPLLRPKQQPQVKKTAINEPEEIEADPANGSEAKLGQITHAVAVELLHKYIDDHTILAHSLESEAIMRGLAKELGENEEEWGIIGLLHDIDWQLTKHTPEAHCVKAVPILQEAGASQYLINCIISHCYGNELVPAYRLHQRKTKVEHALAAAETVAGLVVASALVRPDKSLSGVELDSLLKKFNNKSFAANCNRTIIQECIAAGVDLNKFLQIALDSLKQISTKIGL
ncbi:MAG: lysine--tRNA ligase [Candidatus Falkowbacteria bacterium]